MTWGEWMTWMEGYNLGQYGVEIQLLRQIAYQQITLNPYIDKTDKPRSIIDYMRFPGEQVQIAEFEYISPTKLAEIWKT